MKMTMNTCCDAAKLREKLGRTFAGLTHRTAEVQQRCRASLLGQEDALRETVCHLLAHDNQAGLTSGSV